MDYSGFEIKLICPDCGSDLNITYRSRYPGITEYKMRCYKCEWETGHFTVPELFAKFVVKQKPKRCGNCTMTVMYVNNECHCDPKGGRCNYMAYDMSEDIARAIMEDER
jgi:hypothetical protein